MLTTCLLSACSFLVIAQDQPSVPLAQYDPFSIKPVLSNVNIPVNIPVKDLERTINQQIDSIIYDDQSFTDNNNDGIKFRATKLKPITLKLLGQDIRYQVPIHLNIIKDVYLTELEAQGDINLIFKTTLQVLPNWKLNPITELVSHEWLKTPTLNVGFDMPITYIADMAVKKSKKIIAAEIDAQLAKSIDLKALAQQAWNAIQAPILISPAYKTWVKITPTEISMSPLSSQQGMISTVINLNGMSDIQIGEKPAFRPNSTLPPFQLKSALSRDSFTIHLITDIPYYEAAALVRDTLKGQVFENGKKKVKIEEINVYGQGNNLIIKVTMSGSYKGDIYLSGKPVYSFATNEIILENLDYEVETRNFLARSASWLFHKTILTKFESFLKFPISENLKGIQSTVQQSLNNYEIMGGVSLQGRLQTLQVNEIYLTATSIRVLLQSTGKLNMLVKIM
ncbi:MAG: DUF4403 family protein [Saprospiraceae bacterium]